jgi:dynein heavy chain
LELLVSHGKHVLLTGPTGTGKTLIIKDLLLNKLKPEKYVPAFFSFSYTTSTNQTQDLIDSKVISTQGGTDTSKMVKHHDWSGPVGDKTAVVFIDDLNMPAPDAYGAQPPVELLRQFLDQGGWYDRHTNAFKKIMNTQLVAAMQGTLHCNEG